LLYAGKCVKLLKVFLFALPPPKNDPAIMTIDALPAHVIKFENKQKLLFVTSWDNGGFNNTGPKPKYP
jgi:hypothetical protein